MPFCGIIGQSHYFRFGLKTHNTFTQNAIIDIRYQLRFQIKELIIPWWHLRIYALPYMNEFLYYVLHHI